MAKQTGTIKLIGTIQNCTFYRMQGNYYCRRKSSIDRKRVLKDPSYAIFRLRSHQFRLATKLASKIYRSFEKEKKVKGAFQRLCGEIINLFKKGMNEREIWAQYIKTKISSIKKGILFPKPDYGIHTIKLEGICVGRDTNIFLLPTYKYFLLFKKICLNLLSKCFYLD